MDFDDLIEERPSTGGAPVDQQDHQFYEGAVAMHLLWAEPVRIGPRSSRRSTCSPGWIEHHGFRRVAKHRSPFAGSFENTRGRRIVVHPRSGLSDVTPDANGTMVEAEREGGVTQARHLERLSKQDKGPLRDRRAPDAAAG